VDRAVLLMAAPDTLEPCSVVFGDGELNEQPEANSTKHRRASIRTGNMAGGRKADGRASSGQGGGGGFSFSFIYTTRQAEEARHFCDIYSL